MRQIVITVVLAATIAWRPERVGSREFVERSTPRG